MKKIIILISIIVVTKYSFSQQFTTNSQYMHTKYAVNPAFAGTNNGIELGAMYKQYWSGFNNAPNMKQFYAHSPITNSMGIGGRVYNYTSGLLSNGGFELTYAYRIKITNEIYLSMGISALLEQHSLNKEGIDVKTQNDNLILTASNNFINYNSNAGLVLYGENFHIGLSSYYLIPSNVNFASNYLINKQERHYFLNGGYNIEINNDFSVEPTFLLKYIESNVFQFDVGANVLIHNTVFVGINYRNNAAAVIMVGIKTDKLKFGYAYDYLLSDINSYSNGSHELMLILNLGKKSSSLLE